LAYLPFPTVVAANNLEKRQRQKADQRPGSNSQATAGPIEGQNAKKSFIEASVSKNPAPLSSASVYSRLIAFAGFDSQGGQLRRVWNKECPKE
jgi:hypothetical protein